MFNLLVMPSVWGLFTMPTEVSGEKYGNARNGLEILWNTIIFLAPGKWLEGCQKISAAIRSLWLILEEYACLNFASKKSGTPARGHQVKQANSLCRMSESWARQMMRRTMVSQLREMRYMNLKHLKGVQPKTPTFARVMWSEKCGNNDTYRQCSHNHPDELM